MNCSVSGFWVKKWSSFRFWGPFCQRSYFLNIVSAPTHKGKMEAKMSSAEEIYNLKRRFLDGANVVKCYRLAASAVFAVLKEGSAAFKALAASD